jgi:hypothetical protein
MKGSNLADHQLHRLPIVSPSRKLPYLQIHSHFVQTVSRVSRKHDLNSEFVSKIPKRPKEDGARQPKNSPSLANVDTHIPKNVGKARGVPRATKKVSDRAPHEARQRASKEDVVVILHLPTKGANTIGWSLALPDVIIGGEMTI